MVFFIRRYQLLQAMFLSILLFTAILAYDNSFRTLVTYADGGSPSFSMQPLHSDPANPVTKSYFVLDTDAGSTQQNGIRVTNTGSATGVVTLYAVDATTGQNSGLVYNSQNAPRHDVGLWIHLEQQNLTLAAGQSQVVPFQINIPHDAWSGQHIGGIVAQSAVQTGTQKRNTFHINVQNLSIVAVEVTVAGPQTEQLTLTNVQAGGAHGYQNLLIGLGNTGSTLLKPYGTLQVTDDQGHVKQSVALKLDTFLPHTSINYPVYMQKTPLTAGTYTVKVQLNYGHQHTLSAQKTLTITSQQIAQVFKAQGPLQLANIFSSWQGILIVVVLLLAVCSMLFVGYTLCRKVVIAMIKR